MRKALNDNPIAQIAVVGVLIVVAGLLVLGGPLKKDSGSTPATVATGTPPATPGTAAPAPATSATPPAAGAPPAAGSTATSSPSGLPLVAGPPLPRSVRSAYKQGKVVVLLAVRGGGLDDRLLRRATAGLHAIPGIAVFTTRARGIARYARITQGAGVSRVPALVVVRPRDLSKGTPTAEVRYGFRTAASVIQAVRDALYRGPTLSYAPN
jgi:hypothetical protein